MARIARAVAAGHPHHITQRGNREERIFFRPADYRTYLAFMAEACAKEGVRIWAWCLMPNHVHLVVVPRTAGGLARAVGEAHRRYTRLINLRKGWQGHLLQGRFASCVLEASRVLAAVRFIERNPVRAGRVKRPWQWPWSSARARVAGLGDALVAAGGPLAAKVPDWRRFLAAPEDAKELAAIRHHLRTGRPLGGPAFVARLERRLGRVLHCRKRGRPPGRKNKRKM